jgi:hypothetical protein
VHNRNRGTAAAPKKTDDGHPVPRARAFATCQGAGKNKTGDPRGGWVGQSTKKGWGQIFLVIFLVIFFFTRVFDLPSPRNAQKRDKKVEKKIGFGFLVFGRFFCKNFSTRSFAKRFL